MIFIIHTQATGKLPNNYTRILSYAVLNLYANVKNKSTLHE